MGSLGDLNILKAEIDFYNSFSVSSLKNEIEILKQDKTTLESRVSTLEQENTTLNTQIQNILTRLPNS
jgi:predicted  nucleic acid-binding Zn-ribbon protein